MKISWNKCPSCKTVNHFNIEGGGGTTQDFGEPKAYPCRGCNKLLSNGLKEWQHLTWSKKAIAILRTIYTILLIGLGAGGIVSAIGMYALGLEDKEGQLIKFSIVIVTISLVLFSFLYVRGLVREISASNERMLKKKT